MMRIQQGMDKIFELAFHKIGEFYMASRYMKKIFNIVCQLSGKCQLKLNWDALTYPPK